MSVRRATAEYQKCLDKFLGLYEGWIVKRKKAIELLVVIVQEMDSSEFQNNVTSIVGSSVGVVGGAMVIGGLLLAPFTGGLSTIASLAGAGVGAIGGVTNLTSDKISENYALKKCKEAQDIIDEDQKDSKNLEDSEKNLTAALVLLKKEADACNTDITNILRTVSITDKSIKIGRIVSKTATLITSGTRGMGAAGIAAGKVIGKASGVLAVVGIGFDVWNIVSSSQDIANGSKSKLGKEVTNHIENLKKSLEAVKKYYSDTYGIDKN